MSAGALAPTSVVRAVAGLPPLLRGLLAPLRLPNPATSSRHLAAAGIKRIAAALKPLYRTEGFETDLAYYLG